MQKIHFSALLLFSAALFFASCKDKEIAPLVIPDTYTSTDFEQNAAFELSVIAQLGKLNTTAKQGRMTGTAVSLDSLILMYSGSTPDLSSLTSSYFAPKATSLYEQLAAASGGIYSPGSPAGSGGVYEGYLFNNNGLEPGEAADKGLYGALLFRHFGDLSRTLITPETVDRMVAIYGANPSFANSYQADKHAAPDVLCANYAARRDKNDGNGYYSIIRNAFIQLKAAVEAGANYNDEREEALLTIKTNWEKANAGTIINYLQSVVSKLSATNPTNAETAAALHAYAEAVGFLHGWHSLPEKTITDQQIEDLLFLMKAPVNENAAAYQFATNPAATLPDLILVINQLKSIYGFSDAEIEDFKKNWVAEQNR